MAERSSSNGTKTADRPSGDGLGDEVKHLMTAVAGRAMSGASGRVGSVTERLANGGGGGGSAAGKALGKAGEKAAEGESPLKAGLSAGVEGIKSKVGGMFGGGGGGGGKDRQKRKLKFTNIVEEIDIGAPVHVVYDQWTRFQDFSNFMKKVESVDQDREEQVTFKAQVLWSHRQWKAKIVDQVPDKHIVWKSSGDKGKVDGAVTFHELAPDLTRVLVVLEYHQQGLFERTGNLWRAQGRRVRLELKHFRRHVMTHAMLHPDEIDGWRGEIHDGKVEVSDEEAREREERDESDESSDQSDAPEDSGDDDAQDEAEDDYDDDESDDDEPEDEYDDEVDEDEAEDDEPEDDEPEDEADDDVEDEYDEDEEPDDEVDDPDDEADEDEEPDEAPRARPRRRRAGAGRR